MEWLAAHWALIIAIAMGVVSEALAIVQMLKFPTNSGVGGVLSGILNVLKGLSKSE